MSCVVGFCVFASVEREMGSRLLQISQFVGDEMEEEEIDWGIRKECREFLTWDTPLVIRACGWSLGE